MNYPGDLSEQQLACAIKRFIESPKASLNPDNGILRDLISGWDNLSYSAHDEYLTSCIFNSLIHSTSPILECGSGLTTILIGIIADQSYNTIWSLEDSEVWGNRVRVILDAFNINSVHLLVKPLKDYGSFFWYDPPLNSMPERFGLVICDGPPGNTIGGRYGLLPVMRSRLANGTLILLDDASRPDEQIIMDRWKQEFKIKAEFAGIRKPFCKIIM